MRRMCASATMLHLLLTCAVVLMLHQKWLCVCTVFCACEMKENNRKVKIKRNDFKMYCFIEGAKVVPELF